MKKAFTLVEIIAVIVVIAILSLLLIPKVISTINENELKLYKEAEHRIEDASLKYILDNYYDSSVNSVTININDLISAGLIDEVKDINDKSICSGYVVLNNLNANIEAKGYISCHSYQTSGWNME